MSTKILRGLVNLGLASLAVLSGMIACAQIASTTNAAGTATTSTTSITNTTAAPSENPIVGRWRGLGMGASTVLVIKSNHAVLFEGDAKTDPGLTWSVESGQYRIVYAQGDPPWEVTFDDQGQMIWTMPEMEKEAAAEGRPAWRPKFRRDEPSAGTRKPSVPSPAPEGEWRFAYVRQSGINMAPDHDVMIFDKNGKIRMKSTILAKEVEFTYRIEGEKIIVKTGFPVLPTVEYLYRWEDNGKKLILKMERFQNTMFESIWVFMRPDDFPKNEIAGTWLDVTPDREEDLELVLGTDGSCIFQEVQPGDDHKTASKESPKYFYRLWTSSMGSMLTIVLPPAEFGAMVQTEMLHYERKGNKLTFTPIVMESDDEIQQREVDQTVWILKENGPINKRSDQ